MIYSFIAEETICGSGWKGYADQKWLNPPLWKKKVDLKNRRPTAAYIFEICKDTQKRKNRGYKRQQESSRATKAAHKFLPSNLIKVTNKPINTLHSMSLY